MTYMSVMERDDLIEGDIGEMGDYSVVELLVEQAEAHGRTGGWVHWRTETRTNPTSTHCPGFNQGPIVKNLLCDFTGFPWFTVPPGC